jgi:hypothetical protein
VEPITTFELVRVVSQNGWLLSRRGRSAPADASGLDTHRDSITRRLNGRVTMTPARRPRWIGSCRSTR